MSILTAALQPPGDSDVIELKLMMVLEAFNVLVCDQSCSTADIKVKGRKQFPLSSPLTAAPPPLAVLFTDPLRVCPLQD